MYYKKNEVAITRIMPSILIQSTQYTNPSLRLFYGLQATSIRRLSKTPSKCSSFRLNENLPYSMA